MWLVTYWRNSFPQAEEILRLNNIKKDSEHAHLWSSVGGKSEILQAHLWTIIYIDRKIMTVRTVWDFVIVNNEIPGMTFPRTRGTAMVHSSVGHIMVKITLVHKIFFYCAGKIWWMLVCVRTHPGLTLFCMVCSRVFTRSRGWKSSVEHVPLREPHMKALRAGWA